MWMRRIIIQAEKADHPQCGCTFILLCINISGALNVKTTILNFSYFEIFIEMGTLIHILFNRRLRFFF